METVDGRFVVHTGTKYRFVYEVVGQRWQTTALLIAVQGNHFVVNLHPVGPSIATIPASECISVTPVPKDAGIYINEPWKGDP